MMKKTLGLFLITFVIFSCGTKQQKDEKECSEKEIKAITVEQVLADTKNLVEEEVVVTGMVNHVCSHGGKRMFIIGKDSDAGLRITPNEEIGVFEKELEGNTVLIQGVLKELIINDDYVAQLEQEVAEGMDNEALHDHSGDEHGEHEEAEVDSSKIKQIEQMKADIAESEEGFVAQYWIEASKVEIKECDHEGEEKTADCEEKEEEHNHDEHAH
ncbi:MAG: hypothetical protein V2I54_02105 [Bacteroidales bacterium]|jgi:hypothetical protein|nr:hypothetical protein [Bacteroidales bacterium]